MPSRRAAALGSIVLAALAAGFTAGVLVHPAQAQSLTTSTIFVPPGGLMFRAQDGSPIARLSRDAHGGSFELFDDRVGLRPAMSPSPYTVDEKDPFSKPVGAERRPGPGF